jgi:phenylalanyl-tRNA synthetase beta chain
MKFSYDWLRELSGTEKSPEALARLIMFHAFEVESSEPFSHGLDSVVIGLVRSVVAHPDADRLSVTTVETVPGEEPRTVVCGAPNIAVGQKVAVAIPGAKLPNGIEIADAKIRGVASSGMICAEDELGLGNDHEGILVLPEDAPIGMPFADYLGLSDTVLDVNILPNRGCDTLSYRGLAREIAALEGRGPLFVETAELPDLPTEGVPVSVVSDRCRRYVGILFENVSEERTPLPIRSALLRSGLRPVSPVVDITNYLMLLYGQPMHAFDADVLSGGIVVRQATEGEKLVLLDGKELSLSVEDLVIADGERPLALAGVMGGTRSGISRSTKRVFLEIATFDPSSVRATASRNRLSTDASYRFERNVDTERAVASAIAAIGLFSEVTGASAVGMTDIVSRPDSPREIPFDPKVFRDMFGEEADLSDAESKLGLLGLSVRDGKDGRIATVPTFRPDLSDRWDLAEEVGRMIGYQSFPSMPLPVPLTAPNRNDSADFARALRRFLADSGRDEILTYSFYSRADADRLGEDVRSRHLGLANPMNPDQAVLRGSLLPTHLRKVAENRRFLDDFRFFELGDRYLLGPDGGPVEDRVLSLVSVSKKGEDGFFVMKGELEKLFAFSGLNDVSWEPVDPGDASGDLPLFHPTRTARLVACGMTLGIAGEISPLVKEAYGIRGEVVSAQLSFDILRSRYGSVATYVPIPRFPYATRDLSLSVPSSVRAGDLSAAVSSAAPLVRATTLFDIYDRGDGTKTLSFRLAFGRDDGTVGGEEVDAAVRDILEAARSAFGATLPS